MEGCLAIGLAAVALLATWLLGPILFVLPALRQGNYETAVRWSRWLQWCLGGGLAYSATLVHADRLQEAEEVLASVIERSGRGWHTLAYLRIHQGRLSDARAAIHHAIAAEPEMDVFRTALVEILLLEGTPSPALWSHLDAAQAQAELPGLSWFAPGVLAEIESLRAWLHAMLGEERQADVAMTAALELAEPYPFVQADIHWRVAMALRALGRLDRARQHLELAADTDPEGVHGRRARSTLAEIAGELSVRD